MEQDNKATKAEAGQLRDVYDWLDKAPKLRDSFAVAVGGPSALLFTEEEKKNLLGRYTRDDFIMAYETGFC
jgi:hypothetical protein